MRKIIAILFLIFPIAITACVPKLDIEDGGIISDKSCGPPCFWSITPAISTKKQVFEMLQKKNILDKCHITDDVTNTEGKSNTTIDCDAFYISINNDTNLVMDISFTPSQTVTLQQIISIYGEPSSVTTSNEQPYASKPKMSMALYYDNLRMILNLPVQQDMNTYTVTYTVSANSQIEGIGYYDTYEYNIIPAKNRTNWHGFGKY